MTPIREDKQSDKESAEHNTGSGQVRSTSPVSTRIGRDTVEIDVGTLRHLVETMKLSSPIEVNP
jgi:hypothetical protein